jgi:hypothetical protein
MAKWIIQLYIPKQPVTAFNVFSSLPHSLPRCCFPIRPYSFFFLLSLPWYRTSFQRQPLDRSRLIFALAMKFTLRRLARYFDDGGLRGESVFSMLCPASFTIYFLGRFILVYSPLADLSGILILAIILRLIVIFSFICIALFVTIFLGLSPCKLRSCVFQTIPRA